MRLAGGYPCNMNSNPASPSRPVALPAGLGWRLLALIYDCLPMIPLLMITSAAFLWLNGGRTVEHDPLLAALAFATNWLLIGAYFVVSWRRGGQTVGMRPWRLKVLAGDGKPASTRALWLRYAVACVTPVVGLLWTLVDVERRGLYDIASGTVFVRLQPAPPAA
jgi:uncharacterized RDD family membrane protein YckC